MDHVQKNMEENVDDSSSALQLAAWNKLEKTIFALINKVNAVNVGTIKKQLLQINILRGRGVFCQYIMKAQSKSTNYTHVYATLVAAINIEFPSIGKLLLTRCIVTFKSAFDHQNETYMATALFIAHLINHGVAHQMLAVEILKLLLKQPNVDSIKLALEMLNLCGKTICEVYNKEMSCILDEMKNFVFDNNFDQQVQQLVTIVFKLYENGFKLSQLDVVPCDGRYTHLLFLDNIPTVDHDLDYYQYDPDFEENEANYKSSIQETDSEDDEHYSNKSNDIEEKK